MYCSHGLMSISLTTTFQKSEVTKQFLNDTKAKCNLVFMKSSAKFIGKGYRIGI